MTEAEVLAKAEEIRTTPNTTSAMRAARALDLLPYMDGREPTTNHWRYTSEKRAAALGDLIDCPQDTIMRVNRAAKRSYEAREKMASGAWNVTDASRKAGLRISRSGIKGGVGNGANITRGDRWDDAFHDAYTYLTYWETKGMQFPHVNPRDAERRVGEIDLLVGLLNQAKADLAPRSRIAQTRVSN